MVRNKYGVTERMNVGHCYTEDAMFSPRTVGWLVHQMDFYSPKNWWKDEPWPREEPV